MAASNPAVYYKVLGLEPGTTCEDTIKRAYRKAALMWHPDKNPDNRKKAEEMFKKVSEAYSVILFLSREHGASSSPGKARVCRGGQGTLEAYSTRRETAGACPRHRFGLDDAFRVFDDFFGGLDPFSSLPTMDSSFFDASLADRNPALVVTGKPAGNLCGEAVAPGEAAHSAAPEVNIAKAAKACAAAGRATDIPERSVATGIKRDISKGIHATGRVLRKPSAR